MQVLKCWRQHIGPKSGPELLRHYGLAGLVMGGGLLLGKLVQLGYPSDLHTQLEVKSVPTNDSI